MLPPQIKEPGRIRRSHIKKKDRQVAMETSLERIELYICKL